MLNKRRRKPSELGTKIKILMFQKGITGRELAKRIQRTPGTVSDVIYGKNTSEKTIARIMEELSV